MSSVASHDDFFEGRIFLLRSTDMQPPPGSALWMLLSFYFVASAAHYFEFRNCDGMRALENKDGVRFLAGVEL